MDIFSELYLQILNLIKEIIKIFEGDTEVIDGLITDFQNSLEKQENA